MRPPSDIEMAQIRKLCADLAKVTDGHAPEVALCAVEIYVASLIVEAGIETADLMEGVASVAARMRARSA